MMALLIRFCKLNLVQHKEELNKLIQMMLNLIKNWVLWGCYPKLRNKIIAVVVRMEHATIKL